MNSEAKENDIKRSNYFIPSQMEYKRLYFILFQVKWNITNRDHVISRR